MFKKGTFLTPPCKAALLATLLSAGPAMAQTDPQVDPSKVPTIDRQVELAVQRAALMNCMKDNVPKFDDRLSPANVVASAVAWHCEANSKPENYWIILSMRRTTPDTVDQFYRDLALPFVLQYRAEQLKKN